MYSKHFLLSFILFSFKSCIKAEAAKLKSFSLEQLFIKSCNKNVRQKFVCETQTVFNISKQLNSMESAAEN